MTEIRSFRDLDAWRASMKLAVEAYAVAKQLPSTERFELSAQIRRAAVSVPSNVAEGQASGFGGRYRHHVRIALGSWAELVTHLELLKLLNLIASASLGDFEAQLERTGKLLHGLHRSLKWRAAGKGIGVLLLVGWLLSSVVS
jgi:four helix bundle protein